MFDTIISPHMGRGTGSFGSGYDNYFKDAYLSYDKSEKTLWQVWELIIGLGKIWEDTL